MLPDKKKEVVRQAMEKMNDMVFRQLTCEQIESDAQRAGVELRWKDTDDLDSISFCLRDALYGTQQSNNQAFLQWMYLLDVPEREFAQSVTEDPSMHLLAIIVLQRAAFKVFFRTHWKG
jgi:hypothetical protein